jgi:perosamine synthetase
MIPLYKVHMPQSVGEAVTSVLLSGTVTEGPKAKEFEAGFQAFIGNEYTALTNSGTAAITLALRLAEVGFGDEVITSPMTCLAGTEPILTCGAIPVWCDVDPNTGNIDASKIEERITPKTKAVLFVDWAGTPAELEAINQIAHKHGLKTIEDAAHSLGAEFSGVKVGNICDYTCFSFQAIKHLTTVDGGALACKTKDDYDRATLLRWFGCKRGHNQSLVRWEGDVLEPGYKMHMNDLNATIGLEQLKYIDAVLASHKRNGLYYASELNGCSGIELCSIPNHIASSFWIFTIKLENSKHRESVSEKLTKAGIGNNITHTRNDYYKLFEPYKCVLPGLDAFSDRMLNIPCGWWVSEADAEYIAKKLRDIA